MLQDSLAAFNPVWRTTTLLAIALVSIGCFVISVSPLQVLASAAITMSPEDGEVGDSIVIQGSGFVPLSEIFMEFDGTELVTDPEMIQADAQGEFTAEFTVPDGTSAGTVVIEAIGDEANAGAMDFDVINSPPVADQQETIEVGENGFEVIGLTGSDANGDTLMLEIVDEPLHGTLSDFDEDTGEIIYEPEEGYTGQDSFSFKANDGAAESDLAVITLDIISAGDPPMVADFEVTASEDDSVTITLNGSDTDSASILFVIASEPEHGTLGEINETDSFSSELVYTPDKDYFGTDSFSFRAYDGQSYSMMAEVAIAITGSSDTPVALDKSISMNENSKKKITLEASDADGDPLSYSIVSEPDHGNLTGTLPILFYEPDDGYTGSDSFRFLASDGSNDSNVATISIAVGVEEEDEEDDDEEDYYYYEEDDYFEDLKNNNAANTRPVAYSQSVSGTEDSPIAITLDADDMNGDLLTFGIVDYPLSGEITDFDEATGQLTYTPASEYSGLDSFTFTAMDDQRESKKATVSITVGAVNDPPSPISMNLTATEGTVSITLGAFDAEGDVLQFSIYSEPGNGVLNGTAPELVYVADPGFNGYDKFLFTVRDDRPDGRIGVVSILVGEITESDTISDSEAEDDVEPTQEENGDLDSVEPGLVGEPKTQTPKNEEGGKSTDIARADKSKVLVMVSWDHQNQDDDKVESTLHLQFAEHRTRVPLGSHIWYDLVMLDENDNEILRKNDIIALNSEDTQKISFPAEGTYHFEVNVKGLVDKSDNSITRHSDYTGKALGTVVVPEFNPAVIPLVFAGIMMTIVISRIRRTIKTP